METKKGKGKIITIVILIILLLGSLGYIVYDKVIKTEKPVKTEEPIKKEEGKTETKDDSLTNDLALGLGKELYDAAVFHLFNVCAGDNDHFVYNYDDGTIKSVDNTYNFKNSDTTAKLIYTEKVNKLTSTALDAFKKSKGIKIFQDQYYRVGDYGDCLGFMMQNGTKISVKNITKDQIEYDVTVSFCKGPEYYDKCNAYDSNYLDNVKTTFIITKINGQWKISQYEHALYKLSEQKNR